jgi:nitroreductase
LYYWWLNFQGEQDKSRQTRATQLPAIIFVCGPVAYPPTAPMEQFVWSALYPAAQNLIVAARSLGLGTTFTTFHMFMESEHRELLGIPKEIRFGVMIPIGWPQNEFAKVKRKPISSVIHWDKWSELSRVSHTDSSTRPGQ